MSIKFNIVERGKPGDSQTPKKYYPSIQSTGRRLPQARTFILTSLGCRVI